MNRARWRAPGRVNLIGEHTDYNDGFVLPFAIGLGCTATVSADDGAETVVRSEQRHDVVRATAPFTPGSADWAGYVLGVLWALQQEGYDVPPLRIHIDSDVPAGAGLSSSAAVVCSVATAVDDLLGLGLSADQLLSLTRRAENDFVGAPTGGMDQLAALRGVEGHALFCDMRALSSEPVPFALDGLELLVIDSRAEHRHADGEYRRRREGCERAARELGVPALRDIPIDGLDDAVSRLEDEELRRYVRHVVTEDDRVVQTVARLRAGDAAGVGPMLTASHASMRDDFRITVPEIDLLVDSLLAAGALGARMTGGGFGGCVLALVAADRAEPALAAVRGAFASAGLAEPVVVPARPSRGASRVTPA